MEDKHNHFLIFAFTLVGKLLYPDKMEFLLVIESKYFRFHKRLELMMFL